MDGILILKIKKNLSLIKIENLDIYIANINYLLYLKIYIRDSLDSIIYFHN